MLCGYFLLFVEEAIWLSFSLWTIGISSEVSFLSGSGLIHSQKRPPSFVGVDAGNLLLVCNFSET